MPLDRRLNAIAMMFRQTGMACAVMSLAGLSTVAHGAERPNILFAFGDDFGRYASVYAQIEKNNELCKLVDTPNFDRIAREGVLFTNAHVPAPSSTACRSSLLSGQYFWRTGMGANLWGDWNDSIPSYPLLLEDNGYTIGFSYKAWGPGHPLNAPYGGEAKKFQKRGGKFGSFSQEVTRRGKETPAGKDYDAAKQMLYKEVAGNFEDFLATCTDGVPFCYWWGPTNTHRAWQRGSGKELWGIDPDKLKGIMPSFLPDVPEIREDFADYLGEVMAFDRGLGALIEVLEREGLMGNTMIVVSGDHGIPGFPRGKCNLYDLGTRVALAVRYPATVKGGRVIEDFINLMDLAPTFLEYGETAIPDVMTGRSFRNILDGGASGRVDPERDYVVTGKERHVPDARDGFLPYPQRAIVTSEYKYIRNFMPMREPMGTLETDFRDLDGGPTKQWFLLHYYDTRYAREIQLAFAKRPYEELYDRVRDEWEVNNLAYDPAYQQVRRELSAKLDSVLIAAEDPRMSEEVAEFDYMPYTRPTRERN